MVFRQYLIYFYSNTSKSLSNQYIEAYCFKMGSGKNSLHSNGSRATKKRLSPPFKLIVTITFLFKGIIIEIDLTICRV